ncbi:acetate kinase [Nesterenkonia salmonea]|uniref:Acetate kinase n=1 Tax=Nesterenkonia salmonea TaxID=1804987 RepID=A0A5R9BEX6_9MICC|nr:acetate kinase [Nesterenkonia salmonea]TLP98672.1 acetate kinase [Nesterenkonia salmonea]
MSVVLVINAGSSSVKWKLIEGSSGEEIRGGAVERLGTAGSGHAEAVGSILATLEHENISIIGHRVVHGGTRFTEATLVTDDVEKQIDELSALAPLHNPVNLAGIHATRVAFPGTPAVAVFDTAFHQTLPPASSGYALPSKVIERHGIRRYGFHGISYQYVSARAAELLGRPLSELRLILFHLGNGASACAMSAGRSVETSMGMTPLEGLVMGNRAGDLDPGVILRLGQGGAGWDELETMLTRESGLQGLTGSGDMREIQSAAVTGDDRAAAALEIYHHRVRHYLGAYLAQLGGADAVVFTAGVGENSAATRAATLAGLEDLGIQIDPGLNQAPGTEPRVISAGSSRVAVLVVPTNEEREIARQSIAVVNR